MEGRHAPAPLSDRRAGELLLAFAAVVVVVLALATLPLSTTASMSTRDSNGQSQLDRVPR
jgi:hypothetical protein